MPNNKIMISCLVVDDEPLARKLLEDFINKTPELKHAGSVSSALEARQFLQAQSVEVIFLDIQMPYLSGVDFFKANIHPLHVIFTTAYTDYAVEGFELNAVDYLLKPFDYNRFLKAINRLHERLGNWKASENKDFLFVKDGNRIVKVDLKSVLYIKGAREYVTFVTSQGKVMSLLSMKNLETELGDDFVRIHNSYIVRLGAIKSIGKDDVEVAGELLPIGNTYKLALSNRLTKNQGR